MISKILPAHYLIELRGQVVDALIAPEFNVSSIVMASVEFESDLHALAAAKNLLQLFIPPDTKNTLHVNPEFLPGKASFLEVFLEENLAGGEGSSSSTPAELAPTVQGSFEVPLTKKFDVLGDFVQLRHEFTGKNFSAELKIFINPMTYMQEKTQIIQDQMSLPLAHREIATAVTLQ